MKNSTAQGKPPYYLKTDLSPELLAAHNCFESAGGIRKIKYVLVLYNRQVPPGKEITLKRMHTFMHILRKMGLASSPSGNGRVLNREWRRWPLKSPLFHPQPDFVGAYTNMIHELPAREDYRAKVDAELLAGKVPTFMPELINITGPKVAPVLKPSPEPEPVAAPEVPKLQPAYFTLTEMEQMMDSFPFAAVEIYVQRKQSERALPEYE